MKTMKSIYPVYLKMGLVMATFIIAFMAVSQCQAQVFSSGKEIIHVEVKYIYIAFVQKGKEIYATIDEGNGWQKITKQDGSLYAFKSELELMNLLDKYGYVFNGFFPDPVSAKLLFVRK